MKLLPLLLLSAVSAGAQTAPGGAWPEAKIDAILEKTREIRLAPDLSGLARGERIAVEKLLAAGRILQNLYEDQNHPQAAEARRFLESLPEGDRKDDLQRLYRLYEGPIATTLENRREPFLPVDPVEPGKAVYPSGVTAEEIERFLVENPDQRTAILHPRRVVRRASASNLTRDRATLRRFPALATLHPGLGERLDQFSAAPSNQAFYAVPYSVAWADHLMNVYELLWEGADAVENEDADFAAYLRNRARDFLSDDYESGDASWITGDFENLNAQIGSYETYDDELFGVKTFFSASVLKRNIEESEQLRKVMAGLQELENLLPFDSPKKVREEIPVGVYDVIADFGQARGTNTATILPNESHLARKYGRTILLRSNIMRDAALFGGTSSAWKAAVAEPFEGDLTRDGNFYRTLWHEVGHYLGVDRDRQGRNLDLALEANASTLEEMKADLVSLFVAPVLRERGYYTDEQLRSVYASGIRRVLQSNRPRRDQPYQTMQLMQWNWFLENGLLSFDPSTGELAVDYDRYHEAVESLLREILALQHAGDKAAADAFIDRWTRWDDALHGVIARKIRDAQTHRFTIVRYAALGE